jgi:signal transduction histidine kinase
MVNRKARIWDSLRVRVALGVALPIFLILGVFTVIHAVREFNLFIDQARVTALQLGDLMIHNLNLTMLTAEGQHLTTTLEAVGQLEAIAQVKIVGLSGKVLAENDPAAAPKTFFLEDDECRICHLTSETEIPQIIAIQNPNIGWRVSAPVENLSECGPCHQSDEPHLGVLLMDVSIAENQEHLMQDLRIDIAVSFVATLIISALSYYLVHRLIIQRVETFQEPLKAFANGNFSTRIPKANRIQDELDEFVATFNQMADELERHIQAAESRHNLREQAIADERERIAREMHDGLAQVLGYVKNKAMAVRLLLQNQRLDAADQQLADLETAAQEVFVDIREAILSLRMSGELENGLIPALQEYIHRFSQLSGIPTVIEVSPDFYLDQSKPEIGLHLFRITQEALTNIRKHSVASQAWVKITASQSGLKLSIRDNGIGFNSQGFPGSDENQRFGIKTMRDRAAVIGATIQVESKPGQGTQVLVELQNGSR